MELIQIHNRLKKLHTYLLSQIEDDMLTTSQFGISEINFNQVVRLDSFMNDTSFQNEEHFTSSRRKSRPVSRQQK
ncbi:hypothetical protein pb186bvf_018899 [Paramecium bursaria]